MGCQIAKLLDSLGSRTDDDTSSKCEDAPKVYSWDKREKIDTSNFILDQRKDEEIGRMPGSVNGQQFIIQNCTNCDIFVFDHCAAVTIDDCVNCRIFIGAVKTSVFLRDSADCCVAMACQQFRTRDCRKIKAFLCCVTQPIIEATTAIKFGCIQYHYPQMKLHLAAAGLSLFNNSWFKIHDFTPVPGECNYTLLERVDSMEKYFQQPKLSPMNAVPVSTAQEDSIIPYVMGTSRRPAEPTCLIALFHSAEQDTVANHILSATKSMPIIQTAEITLSATQAKQIFDSDCYSKLVSEFIPISCVSFNK